jgi:TPR repeat protein/tRNA A-37 threonylcarbamoyl transferase component Bud32
MNDERASQQPVPERLGDFVLRGVLGRGATGIVYEAEWGPRRVALKVLDVERLPGERQRQRFLREAQLLASMQHPGIVKVLSSGVLDDGRPYLVMEKLEGDTLASRLERGPLPWELARPLVEQVAGAVHALHGAGLVHRDVKPENVFLIEGLRHALLLDVGIASALDGAQRTTTEQKVVGTPAYMAPERFFGAEATVRSDVYELALMVYLMLAGQLPWPAQGSPAERLQPRHLGALLGPKSAAPADAIMQALATEIEQRPASVMDFLRLLGAAEAEMEPMPDPQLDPATAPTEVMTTGSARPSGQGQKTTKPQRPAASAAPTMRRTRRIGRWVGRHRLASAGIALLFLVGVGALWLARSGGVDEPLVVDPAVLNRQRCDRGSARDCYRLAERFERGEGSFQDDDLAARMYERACDASASEALGCLEHGLRLLDDDGDKADPVRAALVLERACRAGSGPACARVARQYESGEGVAVDLERSIDLDLLACDLGVADRCTSAGFAYSKGEGARVDASRATALYQKACEGGHALGCFDYAYALEHGLGVEIDMERAVELYRKACDDGSGYACTNLGQLHEEGDHVTRNYLKAAALYQEGCEKGSTVACNNLGRVYDDGIGVKRSAPMAEYYYRVSCERDASKGCNNLGRLYADGLGLEVDEPKAVELFGRACDAGVAVACRNMARMVRDGRGVEEDAERARRFHQRACELGNEDSCADARGPAKRRRRGRRTR